MIYLMLNNYLAAVNKYYGMGKVTGGQETNYCANELSGKFLLPQQLRSPQILLIGVIDKQAASVFNGVDYLLVQFKRNSGAAKATAQPSPLINKGVANIFGTVHYNGPFGGFIIKTRFLSV